MRRGIRTACRGAFQQKKGKDLKKDVLAVKKVLEEADLTKKETDEIVPVGGSTRIPKDQSHFGGYPKGKTQERKGEKGDNMRCLYIVVTMPRWSVHCGDNTAWQIPTQQTLKC